MPAPRKLTPAQLLQNKIDSAGVAVASATAALAAVPPPPDGPSVTGGAQSTAKAPSTMAVHEDLAFCGHFDGTITAYRIPGPAVGDPQDAPLLELTSHSGTITHLLVAAGLPALPSSAQGVTLAPAVDRRRISRTAQPTLAADGTLIPQMEAAPEGEAAAAVAADADVADTAVLLSCSADATIIAWGLPSGRWRMAYSGAASRLEDCVVLPGGTTLAAGASDGSLYLWDIASGALTTSLRCHTGRLTAVVAPTAFPVTTKLPSGEEVTTEVADPPAPGTLITGGDDGLGKVLDPAAAYKKVTALFRCETVVTAAAYAHPHVCFGCGDGIIRGFHFRTAAPAFKLYGAHTDAVNAVIPMGGALEFLVSVSDDMKVRLWDKASWGVAYALPDVHRMAVSGAAVDSEGRLITTSFDQTLRVWDGAAITAALSASVAAQAVLRAAKTRLAALQEEQANGGKKPGAKKAVKK